MSHFFETMHIFVEPFSYFVEAVQNVRMLFRNYLSLYIKDSLSKLLNNWHNLSKGGINILLFTRK